MLLSTEPKQANFKELACLFLRVKGVRFVVQKQRGRRYHNPITYFYGIFFFNQIYNHCPEEWGNRKVPENQLRCFCSFYPGNLIFTIMQKQRNNPCAPFGSLCVVKRRKVKLPRYSRLNGRIIEELDTLVSAVPAQRLSRNLRGNSHGIT
mgnify:CR=1 FL=1